VHHLVGKWNENTCLEFWEKVAERFEIPTIKYRFNVCTDGNKQNPLAFQTVFSFGAVNFGKVKKIRKGQIVIGQIVQNVFGNMPKDEIKIRHIDGYCKRLRERVSRYCRRSSTFSKKRTAFEKHLQIFQVYNNFIDPYKEKKTPCMIEGITTKIWNWNDIFMHFYQSSW
jgi:hypothetical protein